MNDTHPKNCDFSVLSIGYQINWIISDVQVSKKTNKTFFTIEQASSTPEKWNWNEFGFLSFIFSLEQCGLQEIDKKNCN